MAAAGALVELQNPDDAPQNPMIRGTASAASAQHRYTSLASMKLDLYVRPNDTEFSPQFLLLELAQPIQVASGTNIISVLRGQSCLAELLAPSSEIRCRMWTMLKETVHQHMSTCCSSTCQGCFILRLTLLCRCSMQISTWPLVQKGFGDGC